MDAGGDRKLYSPTVGVVFLVGVDVYDRTTPRAIQPLLISIYRVPIKHVGNKTKR